MAEADNRRLAAAIRLAEERTVYARRKDAPGAALGRLQGILAGHVNLPYRAVK
jgi:hypothetical protein